MSVVRTVEKSVEFSLSVRFDRIAHTTVCVVKFHFAVFVYAQFVAVVMVSC